MEWAILFLVFKIDFQVTLIKLLVTRTVWPEPTIMFEARPTELEGTVTRFKEF